MSLPSFLSHMGGLPNRIDSAKINGVSRTVDTSPVYGQPQATSGTIDQEIADFTKAARARAKEERRLAAMVIAQKYYQSRTNRK